eukprot:scpid13799/ scgid22739/ 
MQGNKFDCYMTGDADQQCLLFEISATQRQSTGIELRFGIQYIIVTKQIFKNMKQRTAVASVFRAEPIVIRVTFSLTKKQVMPGNDFRHDPVHIAHILARANSAIWIAGGGTSRHRQTEQHPQPAHTSDIVPKAQNLHLRVQEKFNSQ